MTARPPKPPCIVICATTEQYRRFAEHVGFDHRSADFKPVSAHMIRSVQGIRVHDVIQLPFEGDEGWRHYYDAVVATVERSRAKQSDDEAVWVKFDDEPAWRAFYEERHLDRYDARMS